MNRKQPLLLALSAAMVMGTSAPAFAAEATDAATREDVISLLWQQDGAPVINYALPFTDVADTAADADCSGTNPDAGYTKAAARAGSETDTAAGQATSAFDSASASLTATTTFPDNFDPMTFLKGMLSPEQQAMFEAFRDGL